MKIIISEMFHWNALRNIMKKYCKKSLCETMTFWQNHFLTVNLGFHTDFMKDKFIFKQVLRN